MKYKINPIMYAAGGDLRNTFRLHIVMTERINGDALDQAMQTAVRRFPFLL